MGDAISFCEGRYKSAWGMTASQLADEIDETQIGRTWKQESRLAVAKARKTLAVFKAA